MLFVLETVMKIKNPFSSLTKFELALWLSSLTATALSFFLSQSDDILTLIASLIGATALVFVAKGYVIGQILTVVFAVFYGIISFHFRYYGEMITYLCMTAPAAVAAVISWLKHPYKATGQVRVHKLTKKQAAFMFIFAFAVTVIFYFILGALGNESLFFSTLSVTTSFIASYLTFYRSPYYAIAYSCNDVILIILWIIASLKDISYIPMIVCFTAFLVNDLYGFYSWQRMKTEQK